MSYFFGRIFPAKIIGNKNKNYYKPQVKFSKANHFDGNIILVLGESLSSNHMSLFGYNKNTTPFLNSLKENQNFFYTEAISSGVSTDVSIALFMNSSYGLRGSEDVFAGKRCLFSLAKKNNFINHFYSSQSQQQLRYITNSICLKSIDHYKSLDTISPELENPNKADDKTLIDLLPVDDKESNHFYILHQRGSHSPYKLRYEKEVFPITGNKRKDRVAHYDNSVVEFDLFMKKLDTKVSQYKKPTLIIYLSDHGEGLGEENVWGHAALKKPSIQIPFFIIQKNLNQNIHKNFGDTPTHFNISLYISKLLGFDAGSMIKAPPSNYQILGNDLDGFAGYLEVNFSDNKFPSIKRKDI